MTVRLPRPVRDRIDELAKRDRRSLNSKLVLLLEEAIALHSAIAMRPPPPAR